MILNIICCVHDNFHGISNVFARFQEIQSDKVRLIIKDSGACKRTAVFFSELADDRVIFDNAHDNGIYNAINQVLKKYCSIKDQYLVLGSDDEINPISLDKYINEKNFQLHAIHVFSVIKSGKLHQPTNNNFLFISLHPLIASHSLGCAIPVQLHYKYGFYDETYKILADSKFLTDVLARDVVRIISHNICMGQFGANGISSTDISTRIFEAYRYHIELGYNKYIQGFLFFARKIKYFLIR
jgi:hypothetical protein